MSRKIAPNQTDLSSVRFFLGRNQTTVQSPSESATTVPLNSGEEFAKTDMNLSIAEPRLFPVGHPDFIPSAANLISPFDMQSFGRQLIPLINVNIKEKVKDFARTFNDGADLIEDAIRDGWRESPLNPHNFKHVLDGPTNIMHKYILPVVQRTPLGAANSLRKPVVKSPPIVKASPPAKAQPKPKEKAPRAVQTHSVDSMVHDYGIDDFKHFEKSILRELEKQEELKVEATLHTLYGYGQDVEIIHGKAYDEKTGWKPVAAPTRNYDESSDIHSQIVSPLHTSIFGSGMSGNSDPQHFHDFDDGLHGNSITHSTYSVHDDDEGGESKIQPVKAKITVVTRKATPSPATGFTVSFTTGKSRYRKRHNSNAFKTPVGLDSVADSGFGESHDVPQVVTKFKRNPQRQHIQSFTTSKPGRTYATATMHYIPKALSFTTDPPKHDYTSLETSIGAVHREAPSRFRFSSTSPTTTKPSRTVVRETSKFIDKPKVTGFRGSVKFGQSTTKSPAY